MEKMLILLLRKGAYGRPVKMTTAELGAGLGMSQQNASRKLLELERDGYVERGKDGIALTRKGHASLAAAYSELREAFEESGIEISGTITGGLEEGGYYLSLDGYKKQIEEKLGFPPYPGTLNIRIDWEGLWKRESILRMEPIVIKGFKDRKRTYGDLYAYRCKVDGEGCFIILPLRTHHGPEVLELISERSIKEALGKKNGEKVKVVL